MRLQHMDETVNLRAGAYLSKQFTYHEIYLRQRVLLILKSLILCFVIFFDRNKGIKGCVHFRLFLLLVFLTQPTTSSHIIIFVTIVLILGYSHFRFFSSYFWDRISENKTLILYHTQRRRKMKLNLA